MKPLFRWPTKAADPGWALWLVEHLWLSTVAYRILNSSGLPCTFCWLNPQSFLHQPWVGMTFWGLRPKCGSCHWWWESGCCGTSQPLFSHLPNSGAISLVKFSVAWTRHGEKISQSGTWSDCPAEVTIFSNDSIISYICLSMDCQSPESVWGWFPSPHARVATPSLGWVLEEHLPNVGGRCCLTLVSCGPPGVVFMAPNFLEPGRCVPCTPPALTFSGHLLPATPLHYRKSPLLQRK